MSQPGNPSPALDSALGQDDYYERKATGRCTRSGCPRDAAPDGQLCARHLKRKRRANRDSMRRLSRERREAGLCAAGCGAKCDTWYCPACSIRRRRVPRAALGNALGRDASDSGGTWRDDSSGWRRYRGRGKRGNPGPAVADERDLVDAADALKKGAEGLRYFRSPEVQALPRIQRKAAEDEAVALLALAARFVDEIVDRHRKGP